MVIERICAEAITRATRQIYRIPLTNVKHARDALRERGERPSLDAIRIELKNTGSKSTIQKYLKELEAAE